MSMLCSRVRARTSIDMEDMCWQESCGFLTARGGKCGGPRKRNAHIYEDVEEDDPHCINREVLVGTSIKPDSSASFRDRRRKYFTPTEGVVNLNLRDDNVWRLMERYIVSQNIASLSS